MLTHSLGSRFLLSLCFAPRDDGQGFPPAVPEQGQRNPQGSIHRSKTWPTGISLQHVQLVAKRCVLQGQGPPERKLEMNEQRIGKSMRASLDGRYANCNCSKADGVFRRDRGGLLPKEDRLITHARASSAHTDLDRRPSQICPEAT